MSHMVVKIHPWRITWRYLVVFGVIFTIAFFASFRLFFITDAGGVSVRPFGASQGIFIGAFASLFLVVYLMALLGQKYIIEDKYFVVKRMNKEWQYDYSSIIFFDKEESIRKKMVIIFTKKSRTKYLLGDKDGKLLETIIKKCPNTMTVQEFRRAYPEERY